MPYQPTKGEHILTDTAASSTTTARVKTPAEVAIANLSKLTSKRAKLEEKSAEIAADLVTLSGEIDAALQAIQPKNGTEETNAPSV